MGDRVVLTCRFRGSPLAVYWKKGDDPRTAPNLVSWVQSYNVTGECDNKSICEIMEMNENRSLVIKEVSIAEQGRYICGVSGYETDFIHNFTDIRVFSPPSEPYPRIEECPGVNNAPQSCNLSAFDTVTITCTASKYFPDIDLFFIHESIRTNETYSQIGEQKNKDGTKNKSVSIVAKPSENPYVCVASSIPGSQDPRTVSVTVYPIETTVTMTTAQTNQTSPPRQRHVAAKVVVSLILILVAVLVCIFIWWYRKRRESNHGTGGSETVPLRPMQDIKGKVSFYELWHLIHHMETEYSEKLRQAFIYLKICRAEDELSADNAYNLLCEWKDTNTYDDEATVLKDALTGHGLERLWKNLCGTRYDTTYVPDKPLNRILGNVGGEEDIRTFFRELLRSTPEDQLEWHGNERDGKNDPAIFLRQWCDKEHEENQVVQLSLALERARFKPLDRSFFEG
ncbi:uncharacterized protein LOC121420220 [Lytechinus variegatus]|uniref:uncharacterized protein LOC121420220 n=1 Tax=Lytechinus variegatus TaxID=7654 RepID=UPI001BB1C393|nr:uncharacterized protein LOC121420220 [Lytechinus variegatus]